MKITAHTGCNNTPDNSIESIYAAMNSGADIMEIDLRMQGGEVVLSHDELMSNKNYVSLVDCLEIIKDDAIIINCDLKEEETFLPTYQLFSNYNLKDRLIFSGSYPISEIGQFDDYSLFLNSEILLEKSNEPSYLNSKRTKKLVKEYNEHKGHKVLTGMNINYAALDDESVEIINREKIKLSLWTLDTKEEIEKAIDWNVYNITTNFPSLAKELIEKSI